MKRAVTFGLLASFLMKLFALSSKKNIIHFYQFTIIVDFKINYEQFFRLIEFH